MLIPALKSGLFPFGQMVFFRIKNKSVQDVFFATKNLLLLDETKRNINPFGL